VSDVSLYDARIVFGAPGHPVLRSFNSAGVLLPVDIHTALRLGRLGGEEDDRVLLAVALAVRAPRVGHVAVELSTVRTSVVAGETADQDLESLGWPEPEGWLDAVAASPLVATTPADTRPLRLDGRRLYLDRYWRDEIDVAAELIGRSAAPPAAVDIAAIGRLFPSEGDADQRSAAATAVSRRLAVIAGGPGTGKTTTVARILALLHEEAAGRRPPLIALAAPTGKAAARLEEAVHAEATRLDIDGQIRRRLEDLKGVTLHRLLGRRPDRATTFRHNRGQRLPHDVVVVDEASMVSLAMMARLLEAIRPDGRILLVGDPDQLASVEAGAVLADIVGPAEKAAPLSSSIALLSTNHRFSGALAGLAAAVRAGDTDAVVDAFSAGDPALRWIAAEAGAGGIAAELLRPELKPWAESVVAAGREGNANQAMGLLGTRRVLCAHREGPGGMAEWNSLIEGWAHPEWLGKGSWYPGRPVLVTVNDYGLRLFNGDTGAAIALPHMEGGEASVRVAFPGTDGSPRLLSPHVLPRVETVFAMTVHKSQGSEFDDVYVLLPEATSRLLTRELLYTALTRARRRVIVVGSEEALRLAVARPIARASGLTDRLGVFSGVESG
jgi:exodeoxyribonuclease V alpha subunit